MAHVNVELFVHMVNKNATTEVTLREQVSECNPGSVGNPFPEKPPSLLAVHKSFFNDLLNVSLAGITSYSLNPPVLPGPDPQTAFRRLRNPS